MEDISKKFGASVRKIRLKQGLSQGEVSRRLNLHRSYISGIERGVRNPSLKVVQKIAKALGAKPSNRHTCLWLQNLWANRKLTIL